MTYDGIEYIALRCVGLSLSLAPVYPQPGTVVQPFGQQGTGITVSVETIAVTFSSATNGTRQLLNFTSPMSLVGEPVGLRSTLASSSRLEASSFFGSAQLSSAAVLVSCTAVGHLDKSTAGNSAQWSFELGSCEAAPTAGQCLAHALETRACAVRYADPLLLQQPECVRYPPHDQALPAGSNYDMGFATLWFHFGSSSVAASLWDASRAAAHKVVDSCLANASAAHGTAFDFGGYSLRREPSYYGKPQRPGTLYLRAVAPQSSGVLPPTKFASEALQQWDSLVACAAAAAPGFAFDSVSAMHSCWRCGNGVVDSDEQCDSSDYCHPVSCICDAGSVVSNGVCVPQSQCTLVRVYDSEYRDADPASSDALLLQSAVARCFDPSELFVSVVRTKVATGVAKLRLVLGPAAKGAIYPGARTPMQAQYDDAVSVAATDKSKCCGRLPDPDRQLTAEDLEASVILATLHGPQPRFGNDDVLEASPFLLHPQQPQDRKHSHEEDSATCESSSKDCDSNDEEEGNNVEEDDNDEEDEDEDEVEDEEEDEDDEDDTGSDDSEDEDKDTDGMACGSDHSDE
eukprot:m51a1_g10812 hypothetical protein (572) ;mRNA; f:31365-37270